MADNDNPEPIRSQGVNSRVEVLESDDLMEVFELPGRLNLGLILTGLIDAVEEKLGPEATFELIDIVALDEDGKHPVVRGFEEVRKVISERNQEKGKIQVLRLNWEDDQARDPSKCSVVLFAPTETGNTGINVCTAAEDPSIKPEAIVETILKNSTTDPA